MRLRHKRSVETLFYSGKVRLRHKRSVETLFYSDKVRLRHKRSIETRFTQRNGITDGRRMKMKMYKATKGIPKGALSELKTLK